jgi:hypothetical protein
MFVGAMIDTRKALNLAKEILRIILEAGTTGART